MTSPLTQYSATVNHLNGGFGLSQLTFKIIIQTCSHKPVTLVDKDSNGCWYSAIFFQFFNLMLLVGYCMDPLQISSVGPWQKLSCCIVVADHPLVPSMSWTNHVERSFLDALIHTSSNKIKEFFWWKIQSSALSPSKVGKSCLNSQWQTRLEVPKGGPLLLE